MNQLTQIMERRFTAIEQALTDIDLTTTGVIGGDTFASIVHTHGETEISDLGEGDFYVSVEFVESTLRLDQISDVDITGIQNNFIIKWDAGNQKWIVDDFASAGNSLASLVDTTILNPADGDIIVYDDGTSRWVNSTSETLPYVQKSGDFMTGDLQLQDLVELAFGTAIKAKIFYDGSQWFFRTTDDAGDIIFDLASGSDMVVNSETGVDTQLYLRESLVSNTLLEHDVSDDIVNLRNLVEGGHLQLQGIDSVFGNSIRTGFIFDPDAGVELHDGGRSNSPTLRGATSTGGFNIFSADATDPASAGNVSIIFTARNANDIPTWEIASSTVLTIRNFIWQGHMNLVGTSVGGSTRNLFTADPDGLSQMYHLGVSKIRTQTLGAEVRGNANNDPTAGGDQDQSINFVNLVVAQAGTVGFLQSTIDFLSYNRVHGGRTIMRGESTAGTIRDLVIGDPDDDTKFFDEGNEVLRTLPAASGGAEANNIDTGGGFERVLTVSDLAGATIDLDALTDVSTAGVGTGDLLYKSAGDWLDTDAIFIDPVGEVHLKFNGADVFASRVYGVQVNTTGALLHAAGTEAQRPGSPVNGMTRYNSDLELLEAYVDGQWIQSQGASTSMQTSYRFDTNTAATDPGSRNFKYDNGTLASVTNIYVSDTNNDNNDFGNIIGFLSAGDQIYIQQLNDGTRAVLFEITAAPTDNTGWWTIPVVADQSGTLHANNAVCGWVLLFGGSAFGPIAFDDLSDVSTSGVGTGDILYKSAGDWLDTDAIFIDPAGPVRTQFNGSDVTRTVVATSGGLEVDNQATGEGMERALTTGDILSDVRASNLTMADATLATAMTVSGLIADTTYAIECYLRFNTNATDDFQFNVEIGSDTHTGEGQWDSSDNAESGVWTIDTAEVVNATGSEQTVHIVGRVLTDGSGGSITIDVAKNADAAGDGTFNLGSWVRMIPLV